MVHTINKCEPFKEAMEGEGWAINDYKDMISKSTNPEVIRVLTGIMKDEKEHLGLLMKLRGCKVE